MKFKLLILSFFAVTCIIISSADAYIDPNTGGFFFQTVGPFVFAILGAIVVLWKRIVLFFKGLFGKKEKENPNGDS